MLKELKIQGKYVVRKAELLCCKQNFILKKFVVWEFWQRKYMVQKAELVCCKQNFILKEFAVRGVWQGKYTVQ